MNLNMVEWLVVLILIPSLIYGLYSTFIGLPEAMKACEVEGLELAHCSHQCGCVHYGCVNASEQEENRIVIEWCGY